MFKPLMVADFFFVCVFVRREEKNVSPYLLSTLILTIRIQNAFFFFVAVSHSNFYALVIGPVV